MATGQSLLDRMEVLHPELQLQAGEADVSKGLVALNMAQDYLEALLALRPDLLGDAKGTVTTAANTETTAFPSGVLRIDKLQYIDPSTNRPVYDLRDIKRTGGHVLDQPWPLNLVSTTGALPEAYYTDGSYIYWSPLPNATYTIRWYGFQTASDITASGTYAYNDLTLTPVAMMAVRLIRLGLDDQVDGYEKVGKELMEPVISVLSNFQRERAPGYNYRFVHNT